MVTGIRWAKKTERSDHGSSERIALLTGSPTGSHRAPPKGKSPTTGPPVDLQPGWKTHFLRKLAQASNQAFVLPLIPRLPVAIGKKGIDSKGNIPLNIRLDGTAHLEYNQGPK